MNKIRVGSRGSRLALAQTDAVISALRSLYPDIDFERQIVKTEGDRLQHIPVERIEDKGVFVKDIEQALIDGRIDMAVHSMKDVPPQLPDGLMIGAMPWREDPRDAFISSDGRTIEQLGRRARIGTGSARRSAQLKSWFPGIDIVPIRGNIDTRINKINEAGLDGIILAVAGLKRLGVSDVITQILPVDVCTPAAGQGALGIEIRQSDEKAADLLMPLNHAPTRAAVDAERMFIAMMGGDCSTPIGVYGEVDGVDILLRAAVGKDGCIMRHSVKGTIAGYQNVVLQLVTLFEE